MPIPISTASVLDREFLGIRCRLIELAAALDRIDRAADAVADDARRLQIRRSLEILAGRRDESCGTGANGVLAAGRRRD